MAILDSVNVGPPCYAKGMNKGTATEGNPAMYCIQCDNEIYLSDDRPVWCATCGDADGIVSEDDFTETDCYFECGRRVTFDSCPTLECSIVCRECHSYYGCE